MKTEEKTLNVITEKNEQKEIRNKLTIEDAVKRYFMNKQIITERKNENDLLFEEIEEKFEHLNGTELIVELEDGNYAKIFKKAQIKEKLDKEQLAEKINEHSDEKQSHISKEDLKTPWDFSMLTKQGRITPKMISQCTETETNLKTKTSKLKKKPKNKKETK